MRTRKARAAVLSQARDRRLVLLFTTVVLLALALMLGAALAAGSGSRPPSGPTRPSQDDSRPSQDDEGPQKDPATTSDEYEDALEAIEEKNYQDAIASLDKANAKYPKNADILNYLGYCNRKLDQNDKAMDYYRQAMTIDPKHRGVHEYLGELFLQMNNVKKAENELSTLALLCPDGCEEHDDLKKAIAAHQTANAGAASQ